MNKKTILLIVLTVFLGVAVGVGGTIGVQKLFLDDKSVTAEPKSTPKKEGPVVPVGEFTVNLQGGAFLKTSIAVEGIDTKSQETLVAKDAFIKDRINTVLSSKSMQDMQPNVREKLKTELIAQLNDVTGNKIQNVLFLSFVYQ
jgi:flagellar protein FliL